MNDNLQENYKRYLKRLDKARKEKASYMSNAKWFNFFSAIEQLDVFLPKAQVKFLPTEEQTFDFALKSSFNERGILDCNACGPFSYNEIEWIFIPAVVEFERFNREEKLQSTFKTVDLSVLVKTLNNLGQYEFEIDEKGLKLYGYK